jgi:hypothetical protein
MRRESGFGIGCFVCKAGNRFLCYAHDSFAMRQFLYDGFRRRGMRARKERILANKRRLNRMYGKVRA